MSDNNMFQRSAGIRERHSSNTSQGRGCLHLSGFILVLERTTRKRLLGSRCFDLGLPAGGAVQELREIGRAQAAD